MAFLVFILKVNQMLYLVSAPDFLSVTCSVFNLLSIQQKIDILLIFSGGLWIARALMDLSLD